MSLCGLVALLSIAPVAAVQRVLGPSGNIYSVAISNSTQLVYTMKSADGLTQTTVIPGTDESAVTEPTMMLSPLTYSPFVVWTGGEGNDSEINYSLYNGLVWTPATALTANGSPDHRPQLFWGRSDYLHLVWLGAETPDGHLMYEAVLDSKGIVIVPPALVETVPSAVVTTSTTAPANLGPSDVLIAVDTSYKQNSQVTVQGGLDEPVPVNRRVDFLLPAGNTIVSTKIEVVGEHLLLLVKSSSRMFYSYESPTTGWTELRSVALDENTDERTAEIMIRTMLESFEP